jgi:hypothetical protein
MFVETLLGRRNHPTLPLHHEETWACLSEYSSDDEEGEVDDENGGGSEETVETDVGYDGDVETGSDCDERCDVKGAASVASG